MRHSWIERIATIVTRKPGQHPAAFSTLQSLSEDGLEIFDGARRTNVPWTGIKRISAAMGRQQYDMTPVLRIDHSSGRSIFLPEVDVLWPPFLAAIPVNLNGALPADDWMPRLLINPEANIVVYRRPGVWL